MKYGQFCPIAKAQEIIGEKWTLLIVRELLMGGTRFNELHRGLGLISPTILSRRLDSLEEHGLVIKQKVTGQKGYEYYPTESCRELLPIITALGDWGARWTKANLTENDYDVELLMLYLNRSIRADKLGGKETVLKFSFDDVKTYPEWWIVAGSKGKDLCVKDPGKEVTVYFNTSVKTMVHIWLGDNSLRKAIAEKSFTPIGNTSLIRTINEWLKPPSFSNLPKASEI